MQFPSRGVRALSQADNSVAALTRAPNLATRARIAGEAGQIIDVTPSVAQAVNTTAGAKLVKAGDSKEALFAKIQNLLKTNRKAQAAAVIGTIGTVGGVAYLASLQDWAAQNGASDLADLSAMIQNQLSTRSTGAQPDGQLPAYEAGGKEVDMDLLVLEANRIMRQAEGRLGGQSTLEALVAYLEIDPDLRARVLQRRKEGYIK